jgi:threonine synthase
VPSHISCPNTSCTVVRPSCGLICRYADLLPVSERTPIVTLHEGNTPLIPALAVSELLGRGIKVLVKYEGLNPTGSFKDRGMTMAISKAKEHGAKVVVCASTGNTSAAAAAYAKRAGMKAFVLIPDGKIAMGKLAQALIYGAEVVSIRGNFDRAMQLVRELGEKYPVTLVNSINPFRLQGQKTAAFEVVESLGDAPDWLCIPVGNAGNITAYWMGFKEYKSMGKSQKLPKMMGFQAAGAAPLVTGEVFKDPETIASAIRIGNPANWQMALNVQTESDGEFNSVTDDEILAAYRLLAGEEGIFCEPASAASVAGLLKVKDRVPDNSTVVCVLTGNGLKDPSTAIAQSPEERFYKDVTAEFSEIAKIMGFS